MKPVNNKSLLHFIFETMEKVNNKEITMKEADTIANLASKAISIQRFENEMALTEIKVREFNVKFGSNLEIRKLDAKSFD